MGSFILVQFAGADAADVLTRVLAGIGGGDDLDNDTEHDVGFSRNPEPESDDEPEEGGEEGDA
jgi:hypothetical protein